MNATVNTAVNTEALAAAAAVATAAPKVKLTRLEKLEQTYAKAIEAITNNTVIANEAAAEINAIRALENVAEGSDVVITVGKGESAKVVEGKVIGVKVEEDGTKLYKVAFGQGFDADHIAGTAAKLKLALPAAQADLIPTEAEVAAAETQYA